jgi:hypothetical protein
VFEIDKKDGAGMRLIELANGVSVEEIKVKTKAKVQVSAGCHERGGFEICIDGLSFWLMRIAREIGHGAAL